MGDFFRDANIVLFLAVLYGIAIALGGWFVMPATRRDRYRARMQSFLSGASERFGGNVVRVTEKGARLRLAVAGQAQRVVSAINRRRRAAFFALALLVMPAIAVQLFATHTVFEAYDDVQPASDPVIAALLQGERLAAPVPLPPELFITREIESERHEVATASREWEMLDGDFRQRLLAVFQMMAGHGYQMVLLEGYRSPQRQAALARLGTHVTNAGAYQSYHQYGLAADSAFYRNGKIVISEKDPWAMEGYRLYGHYAESAGLVWGGRWQMMDFGHVELRKPGVLARR